MRRFLLVMIHVMALSACMSTRHAPLSVSVAPWEQRLSTLQALNSWKLDGRAAVAAGTQGWQATLNWRENGASAVVHLAGPFGIGALTLERTVDGLSLNGAAPSDAVAAQVLDRLGFELPLDDLRYWLLGVPTPGAPFDLARDDHDRARQLTQAGWTVVYDRYMPVNGDMLPALLVLSREDVRVRIVVDHWDELK